MRQSESNQSCVVIVDKNPMFARGLSGLLADAGYEVRAVSEASAVTGSDCSAVMIGVTNSRDLQPIIDLRARCGGLPLIGLLDSKDLADYLAAISAGVTSALWRDSPLAVFKAALESAFLGNSIVPISILRSVVGSFPTTGIPVIAEDDLGLLYSLSDGETVRNLAPRMGYSERALYRKLREIYTRIGARNRSEAIAFSAQWGAVRNRVDVLVDLRDPCESISHLDVPLEVTTEDGASSNREG